MVGGGTLTNCFFHLNSLSLIVGGGRGVVKEIKNSGGESDSETHKNEWIGELIGWVKIVKYNFHKGGLNKMELVVKKRKMTPYN